MNRNHFLFALAVLGPLASAAQPEPALELHRVTISDTRDVPLRFDVRSQCPLIDAALEKSLSPAWGRFRESATMQVHFRIERGRVSEVWSTGANWNYRPYVRRAVQQLDCKPSNDGLQEFAFMLELDEYQTVGSDRRTALSNPK